MIKLNLEPVPPPLRAPEQPEAAALGLVRGLRAERARSIYRCCECSRMQPAGDWMVWVPDGVRKGDPAWSIEEQARLSAWNGNSSGWCLRCAPKDHSLMLEAFRAAHSEPNGKVVPIGNIPQFLPLRRPSMIERLLFTIKGWFK